MSAAFSCDHCGAQVDLNAKHCPSCGKTFDAVRCPRCGHQGSPAAFADGCPKCRYLARVPVKARASQRSSPSRTPLFVPAMAVLLVLLAVAAGLAWALRKG